MQGGARGRRRRAWLAAGASWVFAAPMAAAAQPGTTPLAGAPSQAPPTGSPEVSEVIVTAQRRSERLQDVPVSVTAFGAQELQQRGAKTIQDIARTTPGLVFTPGQLGSGGQPTIRGIASSVGSATVGVYIDDTPIQIRPTPFSPNPDPRLFDIDRVEVLRGPQGTLFGASSMGGTIRYITPSPSFSQWSGRFRAEGAGLSTGDADYEVGLAGGGPVVSDTLAVRGTVFYRQDGGYVDQASRTTGANVKSDVNGADTLALRGEVEWRPLAHLRLTPSFFYQRTESDGLGLFEIGTPKTLGANAPSSFLTSSAQDLRQHNVVAQPGKDEFYLPSLNAQYDLGFATLTSVTSYFYRDSTQRQDYSTVLPSILFKADYLPGFIDTYSAFSDSTVRQQDLTQEVRLASNGDGRFRWIVGAFYRQGKEAFLQTVVDHSVNAASLAFIRAPIAAVLGRPLLPGDVGLSRRTTTTETQVAGFGEATYKVTPKLDVTAGVRVSESDVDYVNGSIGPLGSNTTDRGSQNETPVTPKFSVAYRPVTDTQLYFTAEKGFRPGGVNQTIPQSLCAASIAALGTTPPAAYESDSLWSYEGGVKSRFADRRVTLNASVYRIDWDNIQQSLTLPGCGYGFTGNLGSATSQGFELEALVNPLAGLTLGARAGYTDASFAQDVLAAPDPKTGVRAVIAKDGDRVIGVPDWTVALSLDYRHRLRDRLDGYLRADYQYVGDSRRTLPQGRAGYDPLISAFKAYDYASLRAGVVLDGVWDVSVFANNLADNRPVLGASTSASPASGLIRATTLRPRQVGVTLSRSF